jgi:hypothetical protein
MTLPKDNRHLGRSIPEFNAQWFKAYRYISRHRGLKNWLNAARLYDYLLYRALGGSRFKLTKMSNRLLMKNSGLNPNTMKPARGFLIASGLVTASEEDSKGEHWTYEILNPGTFRPFTSEWRTDDPAAVMAGGTTFLMADQFANDNPGIDHPEFQTGSTRASAIRQRSRKVTPKK